MKSMAVSKVEELQASTKKWVESLLGRLLEPEEEVTVMVFSPHAALPHSTRREAATRMDQILDKASGNMEDVPDKEFEAAVDESMEKIRRREP